MNLAGKKSTNFESKSRNKLGTNPHSTMSISAKMSSAFLVLMVISHISTLPTPSKDTTSGLTFPTTSNSTNRESQEEAVADDSGR